MALPEALPKDPSLGSNITLPRKQLKQNLLNPLDWLFIFETGSNNSSLSAINRSEVEATSSGRMMAAAFLCFVEKIFEIFSSFSDFFQEKKEKSFYCPWLRNILFCVRLDQKRLLRSDLNA